MRNVSLTTIDGFVELTPSIGHRVLSEDGIYSKAQVYKWINEIISKMSPEQDVHK